MNLAWKLGLASALMVALGYPGEIYDDLAAMYSQEEFNEMLLAGIVRDVGSPVGD